MGNIRIQLHHVIMLTMSLQMIHADNGDNDLKIDNSTEQLYRMIFLSFIGACVFVMLFVIVKLLIECRNRFRPHEDLGPFGALRLICISELTPTQRKAVLEEMFTDDKCLKFNSKKKDHVIEVNDKTNQNLISEKVDQNHHPPPLPSLSVPEHHSERTEPRVIFPSIKRQPMFTLVSVNSEQEGEVKQEESPKEKHNSEIQYDIEHGVHVDITNVNNSEPYSMKIDSPNTAATDILDVMDCGDNVDIQNDEQDGMCPICLDEYDDGNLIIQSKYCSHYFHKDCITEWLEKSFCCPCCRIEMITTNEIADAISTHLSKQGTQRAIQLRSSNWIEITPPPSPVRNRGGNRSSSIDEE